MTAIKWTILLTLALAAPAHAIRAPRIVHGDPVAIGALPFAVSLQEDGQHFCGGVVIAADTVLTAAHCVTGETAGDITVVSGRTRLSDATEGVRSRVTSFTADPRYRGAGHDAAVLKLATPATVPPATIGTATSGDAIVGGWGLTSTNGDLSDNLRAVVVPLARASTCRRDYGSDYDDTTMICAGGQNADSCNGDSGGPLVGAGGVLIGLVSFGGERCAEPGVPSVYTRVSAEASFIAGAPTAAAPATARVRFADIRCGARTCRIALAVTGSPSAIAVRAHGRSVTARRRTASRWIARLPLPDGRSTITATPDGGRAARIGVVIS